MHPSWQHEVACNKLNKIFFWDICYPIGANGNAPSSWSITLPVLFWPLLLLWSLKRQGIIEGNLLNVLSNIKISHVVKVKSLKDMCVGVKVWISWSVDLHFTLLSPNWELPAYTRSWKQEDEYESHITAELEAFSVLDPILGHSNWSRLWMAIYGSRPKYY